MIKKCSNGRSLLVTNFESVAEELESNWIPFVVLLTAWDIETVKVGGLSELIGLLLAKGARTFVCVGDFSEDLHDKIDDVIYKYDEDHNIREVSEIITTYHDDEPVNDVINYFIYGAEVPESDTGGLLALIGVGDTEVEKYLKKA